MDILQHLDPLGIAYSAPHSFKTHVQCAITYMNKYGMDYIDRKHEKS